MTMPNKLLMVLCLAVPAFAGRERVEVVTTDHADIAPNGLVRIEGATGELNIVAWDKPSVEVTADRYAFEEAKDKDKTTAKLKRIDVMKMVSGAGELTITTMKHETGIHIDYQIMVPREARLIIRHHVGDVVVNDVGGDIDARTGAGDIVVQLPEMERYAVNAKTRFGGIYSDFNEARHTYVGQRLVEDISRTDAKGPSHRIDLHVDVGGISIQKREGPLPAGLTASAGL